MTPPAGTARPAPAAGACPPCAARAERFATIDGRDYFRCPACALRYLDPAHHPTRAAERAQYLHHRNEVGDPRYRRFLSKLADPLVGCLPAGARGLDYGCGPGPALAAMLSEAGTRRRFSIRSSRPTRRRGRRLAILSPAPRWPSIFTAPRRSSSACARCCAPAAGWR